MKSIFLIIFLLSFSISNTQNLQTISAKYDPISNTIIYNGNFYALTQNNPKTSPSLTEPHYQIPIEEKSISNEKAIPFTFFWWFNLILFSSLACFAGAVSGLTVGYLSIDPLYLELKISNGTESEKYYANEILKIVSDHHWLLVTLLLCNAFAAEAMPIVLHKLVGEIGAIIISVTVLLFVGEIIPQAACTGPNQMKIATFLAPFTYFLMIITFPLSYPIAKFMDWLIGIPHKSRFCNSDLKSLIELHTQETLKQLNLKKDENLGLTKQQVNLITGIMDAQDKKVIDLMIPMEKVFSLDFETKINENTVQKILGYGFSRIPIYEDNKDNFIGVLRIKNLIGVDMTKEQKLSELNIKLSLPITVTKNFLVFDLFNEFKKGKSHMAFIFDGIEEKKQIQDSKEEPLIVKEKKKMIGIITLEDVIEFCLKENILDEEDYLIKHGNKKDLIIKNAHKIAQSFVRKQSKELNDLVNPPANKGHSIYENYAKSSDENEQ